MVPAAVFVPAAFLVLVLLRASFGQLFVNERDANETFLILTRFYQSLFCKCLLDKYMSKSGAEIYLHTLFTYAKLWCKMDDICLYDAPISLRSSNIIRLISSLFK